MISLKVVLMAISKRIKYLLKASKFDRESSKNWNKSAHIHFSLKSQFFRNLLKKINKVFNKKPKSSWKSSWNLIFTSNFDFLFFSSGLTNNHNFLINLFNSLSSCFERLDLIFSLWSKLMSHIWVFLFLLILRFHLL